MSELGAVVGDVSPRMFRSTALPAITFAEPHQGAPVGRQLLAPGDARLSAAVVRSPVRTAHREGSRDGAGGHPTSLLVGPTRRVTRLSHRTGSARRLRG